MSTSNTPIIVVGAGYVGLLTAVGFARDREVRIVDTDKTRIDDLANGRMPIFEPELESKFNLVRENIRLFTDLEEALEDEAARLVFIAVNTPKRSDSGRGEGANLANVQSVIDTLLEEKNVAAVMKSTVPPGTGRDILARAKTRGSNLQYLSCPEFLQEGNAFAGIEKPYRVVVGHNGKSQASEELRELHSDVREAHGEGIYREMSLTEAELVKHASNLHLAARISFANEIGNLCEELDADVREVMQGVGADTRIGQDFLEPGVGFGGSCFDKDVRALNTVAKDDGGMELTFVPTVLGINEGQIERVVAKLERRIESLAGAHIAILGLAFKPETDDLRNGPAFELAHALRDRGATLRAWDHEERARKRALANHLDGRNEGMSGDELVESVLEALQGSDAAVIVTAWPELREIDWHAAADAMRGRLVIDGRNHLDPDTIRNAGLEYEGTGRESRGLNRPLPQDTVEIEIP